MTALPSAATPAYLTLTLTLRLTVTRRIQNHRKHNTPDCAEETNAAKKRLPDCLHIHSKVLLLLYFTACSVLAVRPSSQELSRSRRLVGRVSTVQVPNVLERVQVDQANSHDEEDERENIPPFDGREQQQTCITETDLSVPAFVPCLSGATYKYSSVEFALDSIRKMLRKFTNKRRTGGASARTTEPRMVCQGHPRSMEHSTLYIYTLITRFENMHHTGLYG